MRIVSIGELLWDVIGNEEHIGGAPFNFAVHATRLGHEVLFVSAVGQDERGNRALSAVSSQGLSTRFIQSAKGVPTGIVTVTLDSAGQPNFTIHRPAAYDFVALSPENLQALSAFQPDWLYFGTLHQFLEQGRAVTAHLLDSCRAARRFYDVNLRKDSFSAPLVLELLKLADVVKLNEDEMRVIARLFGEQDLNVEDFCRKYSESEGWEAICVTRGAQGCAMLIGRDFVQAPAYPVRVADAVGAGDAFAAAFLHGCATGWEAARIADYANRVAALVASRHGAAPAWTVAECEEMRM